MWRGNDFQIVPCLQTVSDLKTCGSSFTVNKDLGLGEKSGNAIVGLKGRHKGTHAAGKEKDGRESHGLLVEELVKEANQQSYNLWLAFRISRNGLAVSSSESRHSGVLCSPQAAVSFSRKTSKKDIFHARIFEEFRHQPKHHAFVSAGSDRLRHEVHFRHAVSVQSPDVPICNS